MAQQIVPQKIVLKSTTKITLNERFTAFEKQRAQLQKQQQQQGQVPQQPKMSPAVQGVRTNMVGQVRATQASKRLAQQMANRPSVQAALSLKKRSMKQRLGIKTRLARGAATAVAFRGQNRGSYVQRGFRGGYVQRSRGTPRGRGNQMRGRGNTRFQRGGARGGQRGGQWAPQRGRGGFRGGRGQWGGRGGRGGRPSNVNKDQLDNQLDEYMSKA